MYESIYGNTFSYGEMMMMNYEILYDEVRRLRKAKNNTINPDDIVLVNFNPDKATTVVKWKDGTITKVKAQADKGDTYNAETGLAMCICKKALGNKGNFNEVFKKWLPEEEPNYADIILTHKQTRELLKKKGII